MKRDIRELILSTIHSLETAYEAFKAILIAFAKSIRLIDESKSSGSTNSVLKTVSKSLVHNIVFASFAAVFLLAVFSNGVAVTSVYHDQNSSNYQSLNGSEDNGNLNNSNSESNINPPPKKPIDPNIPNPIVCSNCGGTGEILVHQKYWIDCNNCGGDGVIPDQIEQKDVECTVCYGAGGHYEYEDHYDVCPVCGGKGYVSG
jgi:hypothetical protein